MSERARLTAHIPITEWDDIERRLEIMARMTTDYPMKPEIKNKIIAKPRRFFGRSLQFHKYLKNK